MGGVAEVTAVQFDKETHTYTDEFGVVPSVTQVLKLAGLIDGQWFTKHARIRGEYIHAATELIDTGELDEDALDPALRPYCDAWRRFLTDSACGIIAIEERVYDPIYRYAGTLDRRVRINGVESLIDIKGGTPCAWHALQLAGYAHAIGRPVRRFGVYLKPSGSYTLSQYDGSTDEQAFLAAVTLAGWKHRHGVKT